MNIINVNNDSSNEGDNRGRFSDRLKKIRKDKLKKRKDVIIEDVPEENIFIRGSRNLLKFFLAMPSVVYSVIKSNKKENIINDKNLNIEPVDEKTEQKIDKRIKVNKIKELDVSLMKKQREFYLKEQKKYNSSIIDKKSLVLDVSKIRENDERIERLQKEIINLIKKNLVKNINELEILQSELYLLKELNGDGVYLKKCQEDIKEVKKLLSKIKSLKDKYDYLKDNVSFECILEYNDDLLIDKILELKELCSKDDIKYIVDNYKILDEFKFLYLKIDKLQEDTIKYNEYKLQKEKELNERDIDFDKLKSNIYDIDRESERYNSFVREQEFFLKDLENKVSIVESHEELSYRLKGFNQLVGNSFKYLGLLLVNPLKGLIPGIATQTIITKNLIHNLYNNLEWEEKRKMVYDAIDYSTSINVAINNLDNTLALVNTTLEDVIVLKNKYERNFSKYQYSMPGYKDTIKKINKMENAILGNKIKIELMQEKMKQKEKLNRHKMEKIKKLNSSENN